MPLNIRFIRVIRGKSFLVKVLYYYVDELMNRSG